MPSAAHEALVAAIGEQPELLALLLEKLSGRQPPLPISAVDSTIRFADPLEVRPDLVMRCADGSWLLLEVQSSTDSDKPRRWLLAMAAMLNQTGQPGDLVIITHAPRVATWIEHHTMVHGPLGSALAIAPIVLLIAGPAVELLLDETRPELAFLAAWAMQGRRGRAAIEVVVRAFRITAMLEGALRERRQRGIMNVLSEDMLNNLRNLQMRHEVPDRPGVREVVEYLNSQFAEAEARGEARGEAKAVLVVLDARGIGLTEEERGRIGTATDASVLRTWLVRAATVRSSRELFE